MAAVDFPEATARGWIVFLMNVPFPERPLIASKRLVALMEEMGYEVGATRVALSRLCAEGLVERERSGRETSYRLQQREAEINAYVRELVKGFGRHVEWDGVWTIVLASLPDDLRTARYLLKHRLAFLGFGQVRETVWLAPRDREDELKDVVTDLDVGRLVHVFVGRPSTFMDVDELMHEWWDMDSLSDGYASFTATFGHLSTARARQGLSDEEALVWWLRVTHDYQSLVHRDPDLPAELLPPAARRLRTGAVKLFATLEGGLGDRARGHVLRRLGVADVATPA